MGDAKPTGSRAEWREPPRLSRRKADERLRSWSFKSRAAVMLGPVLLFVAFFFVWGKIRGESLSAFTPALVEVLGVSVLLVLATPWLLRTCPARIRITPTGFSVTLFVTRTLRFGDIRRASFSTRVIDGYRIRTLILETATDERIELGIDSSITTARIGELLSESGVPFEPDSA